MPPKTNNEWEKLLKGIKEAPDDVRISITKGDLRNLLSSERQRVRGLGNEKLLDQLYRLEGVLGKYNCQQGGTKCKFQTNCHRLIREEIEELKLLEE